MEGIIVTCPKCGASINLSEVVEEELILTIKQETQKLEREAIATELEDMQQQLEKKDEQLSEARKLELKLRESKRELDEKYEELELEVARRLDEERKKIVDDVSDRIDEEYRLKLAEKDTQLEGVKAELDAARRKAEQGSQQLQGEAAELDLEGLLNQSFPFDLIEPVGKGIQGADIHQRVNMQNGEFCGTIIWESKNTKNWNDRWLTKLKDDQLTAKAELAVIASVALPEDIPHFACVDGIWVTGFPFAIDLASVLREGLINVARARRSLEGKDDKIELLYRYLSGAEFAQRVEMIVSTFVDMKHDLEAEKRSMNRLWSKREKEIDKVVTNVAGMYGDMQGIIGAALPNIEVLELPEPDELLE